MIQPYLYFGGRCIEAMEFYKAALGAQVDFMMRFDESPDPTPPGMLAPGFEKKVMHASFRIGQCVLMASDGCNESDGKHSGFALSVSLATESEVDRAFAALSQGGTVIMPPTKTFWSPRFGMVSDKFGVSWMVTVASE
jgi:PhnB protein